MVKIEELKRKYEGEWLAMKSPKKRGVNLYGESDSAFQREREREKKSGQILDYLKAKTFM
jgi:hypothetical protein